MKTIFLLLIIVVSFTLVFCQRNETDETNEVNPNLSFIKTELGGCNKSSSLQNKSAVIQNDTVGISIENDSIGVFIGLNYICCAPFATECEIKNDSIFMSIKDTCAWTYSSCYCRCDCYYTFEFKFVQTGNKNYPYQIILIDPREPGSKLIKEGTIGNF
jgi:hypothetical protein